MAIIQGVNGIHINQTGNINSGSRILSFGKLVPTSSTTALLKFTLIGGAASNFGISFRYYAGADRETGLIAENFWYTQFGVYNSNGTTWTEINNTAPWIGSEGNGLIAYRTSNSGTSVTIEAFGSTTGVYVNGYCEVQCGKWDQLTISY